MILRAAYTTGLSDMSKIISSELCCDNFSVLLDSFQTHATATNESIMKHENRTHPKHRYRNVNLATEHHLFRVLLVMRVY
jgi:hypothetical protein